MAPIVALSSKQKRVAARGEATTGHVDRSSAVGKPKTKASSTIALRLQDLELRARARAEAVVAPSALAPPAALPVEPEPTQASTIAALPLSAPSPPPAALLPATSELAFRLRPVLESTLEEAFSDLVSEIFSDPGFALPCPVSPAPACVATSWPEVVDETIVGPRLPARFYYRCLDGEIREVAEGLYDDPSDEEAGVSEKAVWAGKGSEDGEEEEEIEDWGLW